MISLTLLWPNLTWGQDLSDTSSERYQKYTAELETKVDCHSSHELNTIQQTGCQRSLKPIMAPVCYSNGKTQDVPSISCFSLYYKQKIFNTQKMFLDLN